MIALFISQKETVAIVMGLFFGIAARVYLLRTDYRQYPTYPHGKIIHMSLGVIAAGLGAVAVPALFDKNYTAVTFLTVAAQQFRDVRNMERQSLTQVDQMELVRRGASYIEGIAMVFEGRNYLVIFTSMMASLFSLLFAWYWGAAAGLAALLISVFFMTGKSMNQIVDIQTTDVRLEGPNLYVGSIYIMNVGLESDRELIAKQAIGLLAVPKGPDARVTIANLGQRQAILHDLSTVLGVYRDSGEPALMPMAKLDLNSGTLGILVLPQIKDAAKAVAALQRVPVLESAVRMPTESAAGPHKEA
ncbi:YIEGIA family protein [Paenibacillus sp. FJAT-26967]|uniref:YIEGIA family protein n=1 Tax=Paenibacillus sp. FJAT-26967 TaxID=1729690 RepID=UPI0008390523|nr:YIEGIA family protein [Paenibacillus sp. FJAT-26967]